MALKSFAAHPLIQYGNKRDLFGVMQPVAEEEDGFQLL